MGLFKKKRDPISERAKTLNQQISALQAEIDRLNSASADAESAAGAAREAANDSSDAPPIHGGTPVAQPASSQPRLRSTAFPKKRQPTRPAAAAASPNSNPFSDPVFENVSQNASKEQPEPASPAHYNDLGVRKYDLASWWRRWMNHLRGPPASNPKLVNYLAAGSIQGLRPLRYEKRVARNRFIVFVVVLILALWGLIVMLMKRS